ISELMELVGPIEILTTSGVTGPIAWIFFLLAPFAAARVSIEAGRQLPAPTGLAGRYPPPAYPQPGMARPAGRRCPADGDAGVAPPPAPPA
ncbi:MAG TPA: hypothetical protein VEZ46_15715, partial [Mycobacteriales bacterium]|nr:hypothetical protein [Mycobacteriales bacterium]